MTGQSRRAGEAQRGAPDALSEVWRCDHAHSRAILHFHHATEGREVAVACSAGDISRSMPSPWPLASPQRTVPCLNSGA